MASSPDGKILASACKVRDCFVGFIVLVIEMELYWSKLLRSPERRRLCVFVLGIFSNLQVSGMQAVLICDSVLSRRPNQSTPASSCGTRQLGDNSAVCRPIPSRSRRWPSHIVVSDCSLCHVTVRGQCSRERLVTKVILHTL